MNTRYLRTTLLGLMATGFAPAQTVVNGDFEDGVFSEYFSFDPSKVPGWTRSGTPGDGLVARLGYSDNQGSVTVAGHGSQFAILGGGFDGPGSASWSTMVTSLTPGTTYVLSFMISNEGEAASQSLTVSFPTGSAIAAQVFKTTVSAGLYWKAWEAQTMQFVATAATATLQFSVTNQQYDMGLDYVRIAPLASPPIITTASPLPSATVGISYSQAIIASGGTPPYSFSAAIFPAGLTLSAAGILSGIPSTPGTFTFTVQVRDASSATASKMFELTVTSALPPLQASPASLSFSALAGGDAPPPQAITVLSARPVAFAVMVDGGTSGTIAPWLSVRPLTGATPGRLVVSVDPTGLQAASYSGRIRVVVPNNTTQNPIDIPVTFLVKTGSPMLDVVPSFLSFAARAQSARILDQALLVRNSGSGGSLAFSVMVVSQSPWLDVSATSGQTAPNTPAFVHVQANTQGLKVGSYRGLIRLATESNTFDVPVELFVADNGSILGLNVTGIRFQSRQNNATSIAQNVSVLNLGDPASTINWTAQVVSGSQNLSLGATGGTATLMNPGVLPLKPSATSAALPAGGYYTLVKISDPQALNSPQYVTAVLDQADAAMPPRPDPAPQGLVFIAVAGGTTPALQAVTINVDSAVPVAFQTSASTSSGGTWLSVTPAAGTTSAAVTVPAAQVNVMANQAGLVPGIYTGEVDIAVANSLRAVSVTLIVTPAGSTITAAASAPLAAGCNPTRLALTTTGFVNNFAVPAGWPATLLSKLNDDCGNPVTNGSVSASFSNGDPSLSLRSDLQSGQYSATWQPGFPTAQTAVTLRANAGTLQPATAQLIGSVAVNNFAAPVLAPHGTLHNLNPVVGGALAPGTIAQVFGSGLATQTVSPGVLPLLSTFNGTGVIAGGLAAPLYFLSEKQLNIQIPNELKPGQQYAIIAGVKDAFTLPDTIDINSAQPGVLAVNDAGVIAQHPDFTLVDSSHPCKPGEFLTIYLAGMGTTNPAVLSGQPAPSVEPLGRATTPATVLIDGQNADVLFAGLTPGAVGLYQINFRVPANARSGNLDLVVMQDGASSNITKLAVSQ